MTNMDLKKRLVIATDSFLPRWDGIARFIQDIVPELARDFQITIIAPDFKGEYTPPENVRVVRVPLSKLPTFGDYQFAEFANKEIEHEIESAEILWTQTTGPVSSSAIKFAQKHRVRYVSYVHSIDWTLAKRALGKSIFKHVAEAVAKRHVLKLFNQAKLIMVPSNEVREILRWYGIHTQISLAPLGIDTTRFVPAISTRESKKEIGLDPNSPVIGYVGRIGYEKNLLTLFEAYKRLKREFANLTLLIVGDGVKEIKKELSSDDSVHLIGSQNNVVPYLQAMDMHVLPSYLETTSLVTLEAMSCEVPVISTPVGLVKEYVKEKENGLLFPQENSLVLSLKMKWVLENPSKAKQMAKNGRDTVLLYYEWSNTVEKMRTILLNF